MHTGLRHRRLLPLFATLLVAVGGPLAATSAARAAQAVGAHGWLGAPAGAPSDAKAVRSAPSSLLAVPLVGEGRASLGDGRTGARSGSDPSSHAWTGRPHPSRRLPPSASLHLLGRRAVAGEADLPPPLS